MRHITPQELQAHLAEAQEPPLLLDVREPAEYAICHLAGSRHIPMHLVPLRLGELDRHREIVVICHHGMRSRQVAAYLEAQGFENVVNLEGGIHAWALLVDPSMARY